MKIVLIGAGNVATSLAISLYKSEHEIAQVYSRTLLSAAVLASKVGAKPVDRTDEIDPRADLYVCCLKDDALESLIMRLPALSGVVVHTAGSVPMNLFESSAIERYGIFYPFQTFSKQVVVSFSEVPLFIEGSDSGVVSLLEQLADSMGAKHWKLTSDNRKWLHLAGVYACNFTNYMFAKSEQILAEAVLPFDVIVPLIKETVRKAENHPPKEVQTGPAVREDYNVMDRHLDLLADPEDKELYSLLSRQIIKHKKTENDSLRSYPNKSLVV